MQNECPKVVPQPHADRIVFILLIALVFTIGRMKPLLSLQENSGSLGSAGTTLARFRSASSGHNSPCSTKKTD